MWGSAVWQLRIVFVYREAYSGGVVSEGVYGQPEKRETGEEDVAARA